MTITRRNLPRQPADDRVIHRPEILMTWQLFHEMAYFKRFAARSVHGFLSIKSQVAPLRRISIPQDLDPIHDRHHSILGIAIHLTTSSDLLHLAVRDQAGKMPRPKFDFEKFKVETHNSIMKTYLDRYGGPKMVELSTRLGATPPPHLEAGEGIATKFTSDDGGCLFHVTMYGDQPWDLNKLFEDTLVKLNNEAPNKWSKRLSSPAAREMSLVFYRKGSYTRETAEAAASEIVTELPTYTPKTLVANIALLVVGSA